MAVQNSQRTEVKLQSASKVPTLIGVLLILASIAGYVFFTSPMSDELGQKSADIVSKSTEVQNLTTRLSSLQTAESDLELSTEVQRQEVERKIPTEMNQDEIIEDIVGISDDFGIGLRSLSFGQGASAQEGVSSLRINASFEGDFSDLTDFLKGIEQNARYIRVNSISVQLNKLDISNIIRATFSLSMEAFFRQDLT